ALSTQSTVGDSSSATPDTVDGEAGGDEKTSDAQTSDINAPFHEKSQHWPPGAIEGPLEPQTLSSLEDDLSPFDSSSSTQKSDLLPSKYFTAEEMARDKADAWNQGYETCKKRYEKYMEDAVFSAVATMPSMVHALTQQQTEIARDAHSKTMQILAANSKELAAKELTQRQREKITQLLDDSITLLVTKSAMQITASPKTIELIKPIFAREELAYVTIKFHQDTSMRESDIVIDWGDGGIERDGQGYLQKYSEILDMVIASSHPDFDDLPQPMQEHVTPPHDQNRDQNPYFGMTDESAITMQQNEAAADYLQAGGAMQGKSVEDILHDGQAVGGQAMQEQMAQAQGLIGPDELTA
ncbi:MAG: FliH/SctL family protein, partial [Pseudomonadota bacterium]